MANTLRLNRFGRAGVTLFSKARLRFVFGRVHAIIAGFGFLGEKIAALLQASGYSLSVVRRSAHDATNGPMANVQLVRCDLTQNVPTLVRNEFQVAVFCLAPGAGGRTSASYRLTYCEAQRHFVQAIAARHYVFISSTAVYPDNPGKYEETSALPHSERAQILLEAEQIALAQPKSCVLRLAGLYSAERPIYSAGSAPYPDDRLVHFIHRDDAARAVLHAVQHELSGIYNVHDGNPHWRSTILGRLGHPAMQPPATAQRLLDCSKFFASGFHPVYGDYFAGIAGGQN